MHYKNSEAKVSSPHGFTDYFRYKSWCSIRRTSCTLPLHHLLIYCVLYLICTKNLLLHLRKKEYADIVSITAVQGGPDVLTPPTKKVMIRIEKQVMH